MKVCSYPFTSLETVVIFYLAYKNLTLTQAKKKFDFNWKAMLALGWSNPKAWLTMPVGALSATYTDSLIINMLGFYFIALPLFLFGLFFWGTIGKQGNKIAPKKFGYFTAFLLFGYNNLICNHKNRVKTDSKFPNLFKTLIFFNIF